jgi:5-methylcytosine-specific restriction endonuclease McrA
MKPRKAPRKRSKRRNQVELADKLVRAIVFDRDDYTCQMCGGRTALNPSHVFAKQRYQNMRWLEINIKTLCYPCHTYSWHGDPAAAIDWFIKKFPDRWRQLNALKDTMRKPNLDDLIVELKSRQPNDPPGRETHYIDPIPPEGLPF